MSENIRKKITVSIPKEQKDFLELVIHEDAATNLSGAVQWCIDACMRIEKLYGVDACHISFNDIRKDKYAIPDTESTPSTLSPEIGDKRMRWIKASERLPGLGTQAFAFEQEAPVYRGTLERNKSEPKELWWRFWKTTVILREGDDRLNDIFWLEETDIAAQPTKTPATGEVPADVIEWIKKENPGQLHPSPDEYHYPNRAVMEISKKAGDRMAIAMYHKMMEGRGRNFGTDDTRELIKSVLGILDEVLVLGYDAQGNEAVLGKKSASERIGYSWAGMMDAVYEGAAEWESKCSDLQQEITQLKASLEESRNDAKVFQEWYRRGDENIIKVTEEAADYRKLLDELFPGLSLEEKEAVAPVLDKYTKK